MAELKPCPFCGRNGITIMARFPFYNEMTCYYALCSCCGARSASHIEEQLAIEAWNRRSTPGEIDFDYEAED